MDRAVESDSKRVFNASNLSTSEFIVALKSFVNSVKCAIFGN